MEVYSLKMDIDPAEKSGFMKIFGEFEAAQRGDVGIAPYASFYSS